MKAYIWDANVGFNNVLNDPRKYGFKNVTAIGDFWANSFHPSSASISFPLFLCVLLGADRVFHVAFCAGKAHHIWAQDVAAVLKNTIWL